MVRKKDPDECYAACPTLFWAIVYVACRRYRKNEQLFNALVDHLAREIWVVVADPVKGLEAIHAILLMVSWPLPNIRLVSDPSSSLASIALNSCMILGLHLGRGAHKEFCIGARQNVTATEEEGASTWFATCMLAQR